MIFLEHTITVLHICNFSAPYKGNFIESLCSLEQYQGVKNIYLFPHRARTNNAKHWIAELNENGTVAYTQESNSLKNGRLLTRILRIHQVTHVITHFSDAKMDIILKLLFDSKRVMRFFHCMYPRSTKSLKHHVAKIFWKHNLLVGVSHAVSEGLRVAFKNFRIETVENAVSFERLLTADAFPKSEDVSLLMMGWDHHGKGVDLALKATEQLYPHYRCRLYIVAGAQTDSMTAYIQETLGTVPNWITVLPPTNNIATYYNAADVFLSPSRSEAFGYAVVEAAYCKNSIVASNIDGQGQLQIDGVYWFRSEDVDQFCDQLELAINDLKDPRNLSNREAVKQQVQDRYGLKRWSEEVAALLP